MNWFCHVSGLAQRLFESFLGRITSFPVRIKFFCHFGAEQKFDSAPALQVFVLRPCAGDTFLFLLLALYERPVKFWLDRLFLRPMKDKSSPWQLVALDDLPKTFRKRFDSACEGRFGVCLERTYRGSGLLLGCWWMRYEVALLAMGSEWMAQGKGVRFLDMVANCDGRSQILVHESTHTGCQHGPPKPNKIFTQL